MKTIPAARVAEATAVRNCVVAERVGDPAGGIVGVCVTADVGVVVGVKVRVAVDETTLGVALGCGVRDCVAVGTAGTVADATDCATATPSAGALSTNVATDESMSSAPHVRHPPRTCDI